MIWLVDGAANEILPPHRDPRLTEPRSADIGERVKSVTNASRNNSVHPRDLIIVISNKQDSGRARTF